MSLLSGQVYQRSRYKIDSISLMKGEELTENFKVWKIFCVKIKSFKPQIKFANVCSKKIPLFYEYIDCLSYEAYLTICICVVFK